MKTRAGFAKQLRVIGPSRILRVRQRGLKDGREVPAFGKLGVKAYRGEGRKNDH